MYTYIKISIYTNSFIFILKQLITNKIRIQAFYLKLLRKKSTVGLKSAKLVFIITWVFYACYKYEILSFLEKIIVVSCQTCNLLEQIKTIKFKVKGSMLSNIQNTGNWDNSVLVSAEISNYCWVPMWLIYYLDLNQV